MKLSRRRVHSIFVAITVLGAILMGTGRYLKMPKKHFSGTVVVLGDSITYGEGVKPDEKFVALLQTSANQKKRDAKFVGQGRTGWSLKMYHEHASEVLGAIPSKASTV